MITKLASYQTIVAADYIVRRCVEYSSTAHPFIHWFSHRSLGNLPMRPNIIEQFLVEALIGMHAE